MSTLAPVQSTFDPLQIAFASAEDHLLSPAAEHLVAIPKTADPPPPGAWANTVLRACLEVLTGFRPVTHLTRWVSPEVYAAMARRSALAHRVAPPSAKQRPQVRGIRVSSVKPGRVDVIATITDGRRVRAVAMEMVVRRSRWLVTEIQIG